MDDFLKMDIFFVVTTLAVVIITVLLVLAFVRIYRILKNIEHTSEMVSKESELIRKDIGTLRGRVRTEGLRLVHLADFLQLFKRRSRKKKTK